MSAADLAGQSTILKLCGWALVAVWAYLGLRCAIWDDKDIFRRRP